MRTTVLRTLFFALLAVAVAFPVHAVTKPLPAAGMGVLLLRPFSPERAAELVAIPLYREPGVGRIAEFAVGRLPQLTPLHGVPAGTHAVAILEKRGNWLRIAYDDSGRAGWLERARWWDYLPWEEYLPGRRVSLLPGLKAAFYRLRSGPMDATQQLANLPAHTTVRVVRIQDDWLQVTLPPTTRGWLRWRDGDGHLLITVAE